MSAFEGPRGLVGYAQFTTHGDERVELQESSSVLSMSMNGEQEGPFVWLRVFRGESGSFAHLSVRDATELRDALTEFLGDQAEHDRQVAERAWDACVASMKYEDGSPVEIFASVNPYRAAKGEQK